jgi:glycosyltransferase involved in cell wall biosynthesis
LIISVIICTQNRADLLSTALESVCRQAFGRDNYEMVVVDNGSTDATPAVVDRFRERYPNIRYFREETPGLSVARNRGWREARGEFVAFLDDDAKANPDWLAVAAQDIGIWNPDVFGGPYLAYYSTSRPDWFKDSYGSFNPYSQPKTLTSSDEYLSGSNLFVRRSLLEKLGGFDASLGMRGKKIGYGEEARLLRRARQEFPKALIYYEPKLVIQHLVRPEKFRLRWQVCNRFNLGRSSYLAFSDDVHTLELRHVLGFVGLPFMMAGEATFGALLRSRRDYPYVQNYYFEVVLRHMTTWGKLYERLSQYLFGRRGRSNSPS